MTNPVTPFRNNLFGARGVDIQSALDYAEMMINTLSATDQVSVRTAFGVVINTIDNAVTNTPERIAVVQLISSIINEQLNVTMNDVDEQISNWMNSHLRDRVMSIVEDDDISDQISNWMSNNFDVEDYNVGDAIESWADRNLEDKIQEVINNLTFTVNVE